jgi:hypothetical protein
MYYEEAFIGGMIVIIIVGVLIGIGIQVMYLLTLQNVLKQVSPENQKMPPGQVWLNLIPLFNLVWQFIIVNRIADSLQAEFAKRGIKVDEARPGYGVGLAYCICSVSGWVPLLGVLASLGGLVCWIIYWVKMSNYKKMLIDSQMNPTTTTTMAV